MNLFIWLLAFNWCMEGYRCGYAAVMRDAEVVMQQTLKELLKDA